MRAPITYLYPDYGGWTGGPQAVLRFLEAVPASVDRPAHLVTTGESELAVRARSAGVGVTILSLPPVVQDLSLSTVVGRDGLRAGPAVRAYRRRLRSVLVEVAPRAVVVRSLPMVLLAAGVSAPAPAIWDMGMEQRRGRGLAALQRLGLRSVEAVVGESDAMFPWVFGALAGRDDVRWLGNPYGLADLGTPGPALDRRTGPILCVATLVPRKGQLDLVAAYGRLAGSWTDGAPPELHLVGEEVDAAYAGAVRRSAREHGVADMVHVLGLRRDARARIAAARVLALPSYNEGLPTVLLEAVAAGTPVVATAVGAVPGVLRDGVHARLVPAGDVDGLASALHDVLAGPAAAQLLADRATSHAAEHLTHEAWVRRYAGLLRELGAG